MAELELVRPMRPRILAAISCLSLLVGCATPIRVESVLVQGRRQDITAQDVEQAVIAIRSSLPELRSQVIRQIYVSDKDEIWITFSSARDDDRVQYVVRRKVGKWKDSGCITM